MIKALKLLFKNKSGWERKCNWNKIKRKMCECKKYKSLKKKSDVFTKVTFYQLAFVHWCQKISIYLKPNQVLFEKTKLRLFKVTPEGRGTSALFAFSLFLSLLVSTFKSIEGEPKLRNKAEKKRE